MYVIIIGGGKVGYYLAKELVSQGQEVLVIERDRKKCVLMAEELGSVIMQGDGCEARTMNDAGASRADIVVAVTGDDEDNLVACQLAKIRFHVPRTVARLNNPKNQTIFKALGIDETVSSTQIIMEHIQQELPEHPPIHLITLRKWGVEVVEVRIPPSSRVVGRKLRDITLPVDSVLSLIINKDRGPQVPNGDTVLEADDEVVALTRMDQEDALRRVLEGVG